MFCSRLSEIYNAIDTKSTSEIMTPFSHTANYMITPSQYISHAMNECSITIHIQVCIQNLVIRVAIFYIYVHFGMYCHSNFKRLPNGYPIT